MGTRGALGFRIDGKDKIAYNHFDSYPSGLGAAVAKFLVKAASTRAGLARLQAKARLLQAIPKDSKPTPEDIKRCAKYTDLGVSNQSTDDWYCLLRNAQGNPAAMLQVQKYEDSASFMLDSLFCEYAYIINLDENVLEFYRGFQDLPHDKGRYAKDLSMMNAKLAENRSTYFPVALLRTFRLNRIPKSIVALMEKADNLDRYTRHPEEAKEEANA